MAEEVGDGTPTERGRSHGTGDLIVIEAAKTLFDLKDKGLIKNVGISGESSYNPPFFFLSLFFSDLRQHH